MSAWDEIPDPGVSGDAWDNTPDMATSGDAWDRTPDTSQKPKLTVKTQLAPSPEPSVDSWSQDDAAMPTNRAPRREEGVLTKAKNFLAARIKDVQKYAEDYQARQNASVDAALAGDWLSAIGKSPLLDLPTAYVESQTVAPLKGLAMAGKSLAKGALGTAGMLSKIAPPDSPLFSPGPGPTPTEQLAKRGAQYLDDPAAAEWYASGGAIQAPGKIAGQVAGAAAPYMLAAPVTGAMELGGNAYLDTGSIPNALLQAGVGAAMGKAGEVSGKLVNALGIPDTYSAVRQALNLGGEGLLFTGAQQLADEATGQNRQDFGDRLKNTLIQLAAARAGGAAMGRMGTPSIDKQSIVGMETNQPTELAFGPLPDFGTTKVGAERGMIAAKTGRNADAIRASELQAKYTKEIPPDIQAQVEDWMSQQEAARSMGRDPETIPAPSPEAAAARMKLQPILDAYGQAYQAVSGNEPSPYMTPRGYTENEYTPGQYGPTKILGVRKPQGREFFALENQDGDRVLAFKNEDGTFNIFNPEGGYSQKNVNAKDAGWKVGEATTQEIAQQTDKTQAGNLVDRLLRDTLSMRSTARNVSTWNAMENWGGVSKDELPPNPNMVKLGPDVAAKVPEEYKNAWYDPRVADALNLQAQKQLKGGMLDVWDAVNKIATGAGFIGPVHHGNMMMHYLQAVGTGKYALNLGERRANIEANRQILNNLENGQIDPKIVEYMNAGANLMSIPQGASGSALRNLQAANALPIGETFETPESAQTLGPLREINRKTTWRTNDALYMDAIDAYRESHPDASTVEAVNEVSRHFPDYAGKPLSQLDQTVEKSGIRRLANFLTFRLAAQRGAAHQIGDLLGATKWMPEKYYDTEGMTQEQKSMLAKERFTESLEQNAGTLAKSALLYPSIARAAQWITGNPTAQITPKGESHALSNFVNAAMAAMPDDERYKLAAWLEANGMGSVGRYLAATNASPDTGTKGSAERLATAARKMMIPTPLVSAALDWDQSKSGPGQIASKMIFPLASINQYTQGRMTPDEAVSGAALSTVIGGSDATKFFNRYLHEAIADNPDVGKDPDEVALRDDQRRKLGEYRIAAQMQDAGKMQSIREDLLRNAKDPNSARTITKRLGEEDALASADPAEALAYRVNKTAGADWHKIPSGVMNKLFLMATPDEQKALLARGYQPR